MASQKNWLMRIPHIKIVHICVPNLTEILQFANKVILGLKTAFICCIFSIQRVKTCRLISCTAQNMLISKFVTIRLSVT